MKGKKFVVILKMLTFLIPFTNLKSMNDSLVLTFRTSFQLDDCYYGTSRPVFTEFKPSDQDWNYTLLSCIINELHYFTKKSKGSFKQKNKDSLMTKKLIFVYQSWKMFITFIPFIRVKASTDWITEKWMKEEQTFPSIFGAGFKLLQKPRMQRHVRFNLVSQI